MLGKKIKDPDLLKLYLLLQNAQKELDTIARSFQAAFAADIEKRTRERKGGGIEELTAYRYTDGLLEVWESLQKNVFGIVEDKLKDLKKELSSHRRGW